MWDVWKSSRRRVVADVTATHDDNDEVFTADTLRYAVTLTCDLLTLTFNL